MNADDGSMTSTKPYLMRAIYEWVLDNGMTPHLLVDARYPGTRVPIEFVEDGQIVLNIAPSAVRALVMDNDWVHFNARFGGVARDLEIPCEAVLGIFSRENHQGMVFPPPEHPVEPVSGKTAAPAAPTLRNVSRAQPKETGSLPSKGPGKGPGKGPTKGKGGPSLKVVK